MRNFIWRWRALIAVAGLALLVASILQYLLPQVTTAQVVVADTQLNAGETITGQQIKIAALPAVAITERHLKHLDQVQGRRAATTIPAGVALLDTMLVGPDQLGEKAAGKAVVSVSVSAGDWKLAFAGARVKLYPPADIAGSGEMATRNTSGKNTGGIQESKGPDSESSATADANAADSPSSRADKTTKTTQTNAAVTATDRATWDTSLEDKSSGIVSTDQLGIDATVLSVTESSRLFDSQAEPSVLVAVDKTQLDRLLLAADAQPVKLAVIY